MPRVSACSRVRQRGKQGRRYLHPFHLQLVPSPLSSMINNRNWKLFHQHYYAYLHTSNPQLVLPPLSSLQTIRQHCQNSICLLPITYPFFFPSLLCFHLSTLISRQSLGTERKEKIHQRLHFWFRKYLSTAYPSRELTQPSNRSTHLRSRTAVLSSGVETSAESQFSITFLAL
jgi:hypothetical protein